LARTALETLAHDYNLVVKIIRRLARRYDVVFLEELTRLPALTETSTADAVEFQAWCAALETRLNQHDSLALHYLIHSHCDSEFNKPTAIELTRLVHGIPESRLIPIEFFRTGDYAKIVEFGHTLVGLLQPDAYITRGERMKPINDLGEGIRWLLAEAQRGTSTQRYKGLGEMNPEQLWETTMNPEMRRLLRVTIEDAVAADAIFTTLMGDQVEPRRLFIEKNALNVGNLDV
jgi:DNA gyrase subunit B